MTGGGLPPGWGAQRLELAQLALQALSFERSWAVAAADGQTLPADELAGSDANRARVFKDLGLPAPVRPARPLEPRGAGRTTRAQLRENRRAAWAQASSRGRTNTRATYDRLLARQGEPGGLQIIDPLEWIALIDADERAVVRMMAPAVRPSTLPDSALPDRPPPPTTR